jgi:hypothetical protein
MKKLFYNDMITGDCEVLVKMCENLLKSYSVFTWIRLKYRIV